ncbi:conjugal transfer protein [Termitidicoccus mucosus]|uniref:Conjugal transfer protein n=1 Tax=Termitidicoccus mucosus TaxID=1184151 RepID=A0A178IDM3_9BACT|nr:conjugal transfer protein [Opitutaceae bacterium TSB47]
MGLCFIPSMVRFDKPCIRVDAAVSYFRQHLRVGDYLTEEGQAEMVWFGQGAARLGLNGVCQLEALERLCAGQHPATGERLGVRDKGSKRRVCYFGQISAPKDVSIALLVGGDRRIEAWWQEAVQETLQEVEAVTATRVRRGGVNADRVTGNMMAAVVTHDSSRALDPQLHTHMCILNVTFDPAEQRWKGVQPYGYLRHQGYFREVCYNRLAQRMREGGYELERQPGIGFTIRGFPERLRTEFSERRTEILAAARERGAATQDELQAITAETRAAKTHATSASLRTGWEARAGDDLAVVRTVIAGTMGKPVPPPEMSADEALTATTDHVFERKSVVASRDLLREALIYGRGVVPLADLRAALKQQVASGVLREAEEEIAATAALQAEEEFIAWANAGRTSCGALGTLPTGAELSEEQRQTVEGMLGCNSRVMILAGDAGTGKTNSLKSVVAGIEQAGGRVFGCAPSSGAADVLRQELTTHADTLQQLLVNESLQRATRDRVLLVDEAGLISVKQMRDLCWLAAANGNRVILIGDIKQHSSVEAGDALRCLQKFAQVPVFRLTQIRRQRSPQYRRAVALLAKGDAFGAFNHFSRLGAVKEIPQEDVLFQTAASAYVAHVRRAESCLAISPVWKEIHAFTDIVRGQLREAGLLQGDGRHLSTVFSLQWTKAQMRDARNYQPGQVLLFHRSSGSYAKGDQLTVVRRDGAVLLLRFEDGGEAWFSPCHNRGFDVGIRREIEVAAGDRLLIRANQKTARLRNGDLVEVAGFAPDGSITLRDGRSIPSLFREFSHGYATTSHAAQGKTVDHGILLLGRAGILAADLKQAYVSNSRFRESQEIYVADQRAAREAMMESGDRKLVLEMPPPTNRASPPVRTGIRMVAGGVVA